MSLGTTSVTGASDLNYKYVFGPSYNYVGTAGQSFLGLDTNIGGPGSASDRLIVSGTAAGKTAINLWDTSAGPGTLNLTGITLAAVNGASSNAFFLNGQTNPAHQVVGSPQFDEYEPAVGPMGAIKKGLFFYPLLQDTPGFVAQGGSGAGSRYALFGLPDIEAFQLGILTTAAQNIWDQTALGWLDRQDYVRNWMRRSELAISGAANAGGGGADMPLPPRQPPAPGYAYTPGPGVWVKSIGSLTDRDVSRSLGDILPAAAVLGNFDLSYKQNIYAVIGGVDSGREVIFTPFDAVVIGLMGGYIDSTVNFKQAPTSFHFSGGTAGASVSYLNGGWFLDGLFKADLLNASLNFPTLAAFGAQSDSTHATNIGGMANTGYRWELGGRWANWYVEPIATLTYVSTHIGDLSIAGLKANFPNGESFKGAAGLRVGDIWMSNALYEVDTSITGKVWDQFHTSNGVTLGLVGSNLFLDDQFAKVYGEFIGQLNVTSKGTGWSAFTNASVQFNSDFVTVTGKGGVRYQW